MKKSKKTDEEIKREVNAKLSETEDKLVNQIYEVEKQQKEYLDGLMDARKKGLSSEKLYRASIAKCLAQKNRCETMLSTIRLRKIDLKTSELMNDFIQVMDGMADEIFANQKATAKRSKRALKRYAKASWVLQEQTGEFDNILDTSQSIDEQMLETELEHSGKFDDVIDKMIADEEKVSDSVRTGGTYKIS